MRRIIGLLVCLGLAAASAQAQTMIKDPAEARAYAAALQETDPAAKAAAMERFAAAYPDSVAHVTALRVATATYLNVPDRRRAFAAAKRLLEAAPYDVLALTAMAWFERDAHAAADYGKQGLHAIVALAPDKHASAFRRWAVSIFDGAIGRAHVADQQWEEARTYLAHATAENPDDGLFAYCDALALINGKSPDFDEGFHELARAVALSAPASRKAIADDAARLYAAHYGSLAGWNEMLASAAVPGSDSPASSKDSKIGPASACVGAPQ